MEEIRRRSRPRWARSPTSGHSRNGSHNPGSIKRPRPWVQPAIAGTGAVALLVIGAFLNPIASDVWTHFFPPVATPPAGCYAGDVFGSETARQVPTLTLYVKTSSDRCLGNSISPLVDRQDFSVQVTYRDDKAVVDRNVTLHVDLPPGVSLIPGTEQVYNSTNPDGLNDLNEDVTRAGLNIGNYSPAATAYVDFSVHFAAPPSMRCGANTFDLSVERPPESPGTITQSAALTYTRLC